MTFRVKVNAPAVTLDQPVAGASTNELAPLFAGVAGTELGDSSRVTVTLYAVTATLSESGASARTFFASRVVRVAR